MANKKYLVGDENPIMPDSLKKNKKYVYIYDDGSKNTTTVTFKRATPDGDYEFTDDRGSFFTLTHDETLDRVTESSDSIEDKVTAFFKNNPSPSDDEVHAFAKEHDMEPDDLEEIIYKIAGDHVKETSASATGGSVNGMGAVVLANGDAEGSGDVPTSTKKKKKVRKFKDILDEMEKDEEDKDELDIELTQEQATLIVDILMNPETVNESRLEILDEGIFGSIIGGIGGLAFGKSIGKLLADTLGIKEKSPLYNVLTSRLVGTAIGAALGKKLNF